MRQSSTYARVITCIGLGWSISVAEAGPVLAATYLPVRHRIYTLHHSMCGSYYAANMVRTDLEASAELQNAKKIAAKANTATGNTGRSHTDSDVQANAAGGRQCDLARVRHRHVAGPRRNFIGTLLPSLSAAPGRDRACALAIWVRCRRREAPFVHG